MTAGFLAIAWMLVLPWLLGVAALRALGGRVRLDPFAATAWQLLLGWFGTAFLLLLWSFLALPYERVPLDALVVGVGFALAWLGARRSRAALPAAAEPSPVQAPRWERLMFAGCVLLTLGIAFERAWLAIGIRPVLYGDEALNWAGRAQLLYAGGGFSEYYVERLNGFLAHGDYPLLAPLTQVWAYAHAGGIVLLENRFGLQLLAVALLLLVASLLRRSLRPALAGPLLVLLALQEFFHDVGFRAMADHLVALGVLAAVDAHERWRRTGDPAWRGARALALAFLVWSKQEGALLALLLLLCSADLAPWRRGRLAWRPWLEGIGPGILLPLAFVALNLGLAALHGVENDIVQRGHGGGFLARFFAGLGTRTGPVLELVARESFVRPGLSEPILPVFVLLVLACPGVALRGARGAIAGVIALALLAYLATYVGHFATLPYIVVTTWMRLAFHLTPLALVWIAWMLAELSPRRHA